MMNVMETLQISRKRRIHVSLSCRVVPPFSSKMFKHVTKLVVFVQNSVSVHTPKFELDFLLQIIFLKLWIKFFLFVLFFFRSMAEI